MGFEVDEKAAISTKYIIFTTYFSRMEILGKQETTQIDALSVVMHGMGVALLINM